MRTIIYLSIVAFFFVSSTAFARVWERIEIPGAVCGNGEVYSVFLAPDLPDKLIVEFMGGGACWSEATCYGSNSLVNIRPIDFPMSTVMSQESLGHPWRHDSGLYFPYCTGDVHAGLHHTSYRANTPFYHQGYTNVSLALRYLVQQKKINLRAVTDITVWGASAGAIGALVHANTLDKYLSQRVQRTLIVDSPGLHFGKTFWQKFSKKLNEDYAVSFGRIGLSYSLSDGMLAPRMGPVFRHYHRWKIGILQSTMDVVMSRIFGDISPLDHRTLVSGPKGIQAVALSYANVRTWISDTSNHTFLIRAATAALRNAEGQSAWEFAQDAYLFREEEIDKTHDEGVGFVEPF